MRYSSRREAVINALKSTKSHPNAEWVYDTVRKQIPNISLGTVYRNLRELSESGDIATLEVEEGSLHYDADTSAHAHFVCNSCGKISDLYTGGEFACELEREGYTVSQTKIIAYGICPDCRR